MRTVIDMSHPTDVWRLRVEGQPDEAPSDVGTRPVFVRPEGALYTRATWTAAWHEG